MGEVSSRGDDLEHNADHGARQLISLDVDLDPWRSGLTALRDGLDEARRLRAVRCFRRRGGFVLRREDPQGGDVVCAGVASIQRRSAPEGRSALRENTVKYAWILGLVAASGCATTAAALHPHEAPGGWLTLNRTPVHLGDQSYSGQSFNQARVESQSWCSVVRVPRAAAVGIRIEGLRNTERPTNQLRIDGEAAMLPMLLAQGSVGTSSLGTQMSLTWEARMDAGPHEICVVAGRNNLNPADVDDFEFNAIYFRAEGIAPAEIENRVIENRPEVGGASSEVAQRTPYTWSP